MKLILATTVNLLDELSQVGIYKSILLQFQSLSDLEVSGDGFQL